MLVIYFHLINRVFVEYFQGHLVTINKRQHYFQEYIKRFKFQNCVLQQFLVLLLIFILFSPVSGDEQSDTWSVGSSAYSSFRSRSADSSSVFSSSHSKVSSHSSGFGSLRSIPESVEHSETKRAHGKPKISKLFPRILQKHDKHEEDTQKT